MAIHFEDSDALCEWVAEQSNGVCLLSFSCGKDSICAWLQCRRYFKRIEPVFLYAVPGLQFVERALQYFERKFDTHIWRMPHPSLYRQFNALVFQAPENCHIVEEMNLPEFSYDDVFDIVKDHLGLPLDTYVATGVRQSDSLNRWASIKKYGAVNEKRHTFYPVYDWSKERLVEEITGAGLKLPPEYTILGRTFDGLDYRFLKPIHDHYPEDYARILELFPLAELELVRMQYREDYYA